MCTAGIGAILAKTAEPHHHYRREKAQHGLCRIVAEVIAHAGAAAVLAAIDDRRKELGEHHDEGVQHALQQRERHHVAVSHVADLVTEHRLHFVLRHIAQQAARHRDQGGVLVRAGRKRIGTVGLEDGHLRHADAGVLSEARDGTHQPLFPFIARCLDDLGAHRARRESLGQ